VTHYLPAAIEARAGELFAQSATFGLRTRNWRIEHNLRGSAAGKTYLDTGLIRFNPILGDENWDDFLLNTVTHEVAHLLAYWNYGRSASGHGAAWKRIMRELGCEPIRCHSYDTSRSQTRRQRLWPYDCGCPQGQSLSTTRHNRVLRGERRYFCRRCGEALSSIQS
jgi:SprT protein